LGDSHADTNVIQTLQQTLVPNLIHVVFLMNNSTDAQVSAGKPQFGPTLSLICMLSAKEQQQHGHKSSNI